MQPVLLQVPADPRIHSHQTGECISNLFYRLLVRGASAICRCAPMSVPGRLPSRQSKSSPMSLCLECLCSNNCGLRLKSAGVASSWPCASHPSAGAHARPLLGDFHTQSHNVQKCPQQPTLGRCLDSFSRRAFRAAAKPLSPTASSSAERLATFWDSCSRALRQVDSAAFSSCKARENNLV